jgi:fermentation-respiration switch protein FrsA (DUF1100 family)
MEWYEILILTLAVGLVFIVFFGGYIVSRGLFHPLHLSLLETRIKENERTPDLLEAYDAWEKIPYWIPSRFGYDLKVYFLPLRTGDVPNKRFVVIAHGFTYTHHGSIKYADLMKKLGFNVILFDERYHGESGGKTCTLGYYEQFDLEDIITDTFRRFGSDLFLGTYGESMGATTALLEQAYDKRLKFVIADCPFADLPMLVKYILKHRHHIPVFPFLPVAKGFFRLATKARMDDISPQKAVVKATQPIMFCHGLDDAFIPCAHSRILYDLCPSPKQIYLAGNGARHAESFRKNREEYTRLVTEFMREKVLKE